MHRILLRSEKSLLIDIQEARLPRCCSRCQTISYIEVKSNILVLCIFRNLQRKRKFKWRQQSSCVFSHILKIQLLLKENFCKTFTSCPFRTKGHDMPPLIFELSGFWMWFPKKRKKLFSIQVESVKNLTKYIFFSPLKSH